MELGFTDEQIERYSRNMILPNVGGRGQKKLERAKVLVIGAGGLGSPCLYYLAAAGVGRLGVVDSDRVDLSNLQRQILHTGADVGHLKIESAKAKLTALNADCTIETYPVRVTAENVLSLIDTYDIVVDGSDNFPTRYLINDACVLARKPLVHAGVVQFDGQIMTVLPGQGPCYRCIFREPPPPGSIPGCQEAGILGSIAGVLGAMQATETLKYILQVGELLVGRIWILDALSMQTRIVKIPKAEDCPLCGSHPTITGLTDMETYCNR